MGEEREPRPPERPEEGFTTTVIERVICSAYDDFADGMTLGVGEEITIVVTEEV